MEWMKEETKKKEKRKKRIARKDLSTVTTRDSKKRRWTRIESAGDKEMTNSGRNAEVSHEGFEYDNSLFVCQLLGGQKTEHVHTNRKLTLANSGLFRSGSSSKQIEWDIKPLVDLPMNDMILVADLLRSETFLNCLVFSCGAILVSAWCR